MKKLSFYYLPLFAVIFLFTSLMSCSKDDPPPSTPPTEILPTLTLESGGTDTFLGVVNSPTKGSLQYTVKGVAPDGFKSILIQKVVDGVASGYETLDENHPDYVSGSNTQSYQLNYILSESDVDQILSFRAIVTDDNDNTSTLDFADAKVALPMSQSTVTLQTVLPPNGDITIDYYLLINGDTIEAINHNVAVDVNLDQNIAAIFSVNDGSGYYLASPNTVLETVLVNGIQQLATTKFKEHDNIANVSLGTDYNIYSVYETFDIYDELSFNANEEKAEQVSVEGKRFSFLTDDGRTGILQINSFTTEGQDAFLEMDIFVAQ